MMLWLTRCALVWLLLSCAGCLPGGQGDMEEEKEPHFIAGKSCMAGMDYKGAIEEFEKALEINPHSASAHFQLGMLYEEKEPDAAAAIYHYQQYLKWRPKADNAEVVAMHINNCKQDLAKTVFPLQAPPAMQRDIEQLAEEKKRLQEENDRWRAYFASHPVGTTNPAITAPAPPRPTQLSGAAPASATNPTSTSATRATAVGQRTHMVQAGESPYSIAKKYGIRLDALLAANPGLDPKRLRVGQTLNIPPS